jgi:hypothetical protein
MTSVGAALTLSLSLIVAALSGALLSANTAVAKTKGYPVEVIRKCRGDYTRLCPGYKSRSAELDACMRSKHVAISNICMNALVDNGIAPPIARRR